MPLSLHQLTPSRGARTRRRRVGRGNASRGTYSGRGMKGQRSRTGGKRGLIRRSLRSLLERVPKQRGFVSHHGKLAVVNLDDLERSFTVGDVVTPARLEEKNLIRTGRDGVKLLGIGSLTKRLTVQAHAFSAAARLAVEAAGGQAVMLQLRAPMPERRRPTAAGDQSRA